MTAPRVLVTRPRHQAGPLSDALRERGIEPLEFPLLRISAVSDPHEAGRALDALAEASIVIFVSVNAVRTAIELRPEFMRQVARARIAALGGGTSRALQQAGCASVVDTPCVSTSEALLELQPFDAVNVNGQCVGIVKGEGGRRLLSQVLRSRGARVREAVVYRRLGPGPGFDELLRDRAPSIAAAIITSAESLIHLAELAKGAHRERVLAWPLILPSVRAAHAARELGFHAAMEVTPSISEESLADAACKLLAAGAERH